VTASLRAAYSRFLGSSDRILLTGHSHQAWPDVVAAAMLECFEDAATFVDDKWSERIFPLIDQVGRWVLRRAGFDEGDPIAFGRSTHELVFRLITALPPGRIVTTTGEFHSLDRQLRRLEEDGREIVWVEAAPRGTLADRLLEAIRPGTALVAFSAVGFEDAHVLPRIDEIVLWAKAVGALPLVDGYHAFNVVPLAWGEARDHVLFTAGGYKYAQMGEGICFLRVPPGLELRPVYTGWFSDFGSLEAPRVAGARVGYGAGGARFAGATFDPTCFYRARAVAGHFDRFGLDGERLRAISLAQTGRILAAIDAAGLGARVESPRDPDRRGGFVAVRADRAAEIVQDLRERGVFVDARAGRVRLGPAPYLEDDEIDRGTRLAVESIARRST